MISSYILLISMFAWGYAQPELDGVWLILQKMQRDNFVGLSGSDERTIRRALRDFPGFSRALIGRASIGVVEPTTGGWTSLRRSHLVTDGHVEGAIPVTVECRAPQLAFPVTVSLDQDGRRQVLRFPEGGQLNANLRFEPRPEWVELTVEPANARSTQIRASEIRIKVQVPTEQRPPS